MGLMLHLCVQRGVSLWMGCLRGKSKFPYPKGFMETPIWNILHCVLRVVRTNNHVDPKICKRLLSYNSWSIILMTTRMHWEAMQMRMHYVTHKAGSFPSCLCSSQSSVSSMPKSKQQRRTMKATAACWAPYNMKLVHQKGKLIITVIIEKESSGMHKEI